MTEFTFPSRVRLADVSAIWRQLQNAKLPLRLDVTQVQDCDSAAISLLMALLAQGHVINCTEGKGLSSRLADLAHIYEVGALMVPAHAVVADPAG